MPEREDNAGPLWLASSVAHPKNVRVLREQHTSRTAGLIVNQLSRSIYFSLPNTFVAAQVPLLILHTKYLGC
jgi:hypothetical protein